MVKGKVVKDCIPADLRKKIELLDSSRRGAPDEIYYKMLAHELDLCDQKVVNSPLKRNSETPEQFHASVREQMTAMRGDCAKLRSKMIKAGALVPAPIPGVGGGLFPGSHSHGSEELTVSSLSKVTGHPFAIGGDGDEQEESHDFSLRIKAIQTDPVWNSNSMNSVHCGIVGWCCTHIQRPIISNMNGKGTKDGRLEIVWSGTAPADDLYVMRPTIAVLAYGECFADGYAKPGVDARAEVELTSFITVGDAVLSMSDFPLRSVESRLVPFTDYFGQYIVLNSQDLYFSAKKGVEVRILLGLHGRTWTRGRADAEVAVDLFGVISNLMEDTAIPVRA